MMLLARVALAGSGSPARPFVLAGAAPAVKLSAIATFDTSGVDDSDDIDDSIYSGDSGWSPVSA